MVCISKIMLLFTDLGPSQKLKIKAAQHFSSTVPFPLGSRAQKNQRAMQEEGLLSFPDCVQETPGW